MPRRQPRAPESRYAEPYTAPRLKPFSRNRGPPEDRQWRALLQEVEVASKPTAFSLGELTDTEAADSNAVGDGPLRLGWPALSPHQSPRESSCSIAWRIEIVGR